MCFWRNCEAFSFVRLHTTVCCFVSMCANGNLITLRMTFQLLWGSFYNCVSPHVDVGCIAVMCNVTSLITFLQHLLNTCSRVPPINECKSTVKVKDRGSEVNVTLLCFYDLTQGLRSQTSTHPTYTWTWIDGELIGKTCVCVCNLSSCIPFCHRRQVS